MQILSHTLVLGSMRLTPCLLMAISRISGKFGSVVCYSGEKEKEMQRVVRVIRSERDAYTVQ